MYAIRSYYDVAVEGLGGVALARQLFLHGGLLVLAHAVQLLQGIHLAHHGVVFLGVAHQHQLVLGLLDLARVLFDLVGELLLLVLQQLHALLDLGLAIVVLGHLSFEIVITSYSIHYTKLYESCPG